MSEISSLTIGQRKIQLNRTHTISFEFSSNLSMPGNYESTYFPINSTAVTETTETDDSIFEINNNKLYFKKKGVIIVTATGVVANDNTRPEDNIFLQATIRSRINGSVRFTGSSALAGAFYTQLICSSGSKIVQPNDYLETYAYSNISETVSNCTLSVVFTEI